METQTSALAALSSEISATVEAAAATVVRVDARRRVDASGIAWGDGLVVTADHVVERDEEIELGLPDGSTAAATLVGRDPATDLALLRAERTPPAAARADAASLRVGQLVVAVGRDEDGPSATLGVLSALQGPWRTWRGGEIDRFIRPDITLAAHASGGSLVAAGGAVIGMNTWGLSRRSPLTIPIATIGRIVDALLAGGAPKRGFLGIAMQTVRLPHALREETGNQSGVMLVDLAPGGPAERAGALLGDVIVALDGARVEDARDAQQHLGANAIGKSLAARIVRAGALRDLAIAVGERPVDDDD